MFFSQIPFMSIGFAAAILSLGVPWGASPSPLEGTVITSMLPVQTTECGCGYAVAAAMLNLLRTAECLAEIQAGKSNMQWSIQVLQNDQDMIRSYGKPPPISLADIEALIAGYEIDTAAFRISPASWADIISAAPMPIILHTGGQFPHFILAIDAKDDEILLFDPTSGLAVLSESELQHLVSGYCLVPGRLSKMIPKGTIRYEQYRKSLESLKVILWKYAQKQDNTKAPMSTSRSKRPRCSGMLSIFLS
jgi:hypothetical protein